MSLKKFAILSMAVSAAITTASADNKFFINQAGYDKDQPISIVVQSSDNLEGTKWTLFSSPEGGMTGGTVASGTFGKGQNPDNWSKDNNSKYYTVNIENITSNFGYFYLSVAAGSPSSSDRFYINGEALAEKTLMKVMNYFYNDRASASAIQSEDKKVSVYGSSGTTRDVRGGWYDASGDVSKYLSHLSYANYLNPQQTPLTVWALTFAAERIPTLLKKFTTKATAAEEAAYGADFLVRMLDEQGFFYMTVFDSWGMLPRTLCAFSGSDGQMNSDYQTAFREGGGMAIAALARAAAFGIKGEFTSEEYLAAAQKAYAHLKTKQSIGGSCAYCDDKKENIIDDYTALLAATELFFATNGKSEYMNDMEKRAANLAERISNDGYFWSDDAKTRPFWHASDAGLPIIALTRFLEAEMRIEREPCPATADCALELAEIAINAAHKAISKHIGWLISVTNKVDNPFGYARQTYKTGGNIKDGFFIPHDNESNYWWQGEDARLASLAAAVMFAKNDLGLKSPAINKYAANQLDWILGKNPYETCMMYGIGKKNPTEYSGSSEYAKTLEGGIANGITGKNEDGSGIAWDDDGVGVVGFDPQMEAWNNWRWIEQWLPHSTWYLMALATRYDEKPVGVTPPLSIQPKAIASAKFSVEMHGKMLTVNGSRNAKVQVLGLDGTEIATGKLNAGHTSFDLSKVKSSVYMVKVEGLGAKRIIVK